MFDISIIIIILLSITILYILFKESIKESFTLIPVKSNIDGEIYPVVSKYNDKEIAANNIGEMNLFTLNLLKKLKQVYLDSELSSNHNSIDYNRGKNIISILLKRFNTESFKENDSDDPNKTSYTTDKGKIIALCLREKQSGKNKLHDIDLVKFVLLHEIAHIVTVSYSHDSSFWINFKFLLNFCEKYNLYTSVDYAKKNEMYCGLIIEYNPVYDPKVPSYFKKNLINV